MKRRLLESREVQLEKGELKPAEDALTKAAAGPTAGRETFYALGDVKFAENEMDEAIKWYQKAAATESALGGRPGHKPRTVRAEEGGS